MRGIKGEFTPEGYDAGINFLWVGELEIAEFVDRQLWFLLPRDYVVDRLEDVESFEGLQ